MTLGEKIQLSRKKKGMSQEDLANLLNVSRQAVQKWESGASTPELNKLVEMSNIFEVSLDWLVKDVNVEEQPSNKDAHSDAAPPLANTKTRNSYLVIKVFLIIGMVLTPLSFSANIMRVFSFENTGVVLAVLAIMYAITLTLGIPTLGALQKGKTKREIIGFAIMTIVCLSFIAGILMLASKDPFHPDKEKFKHYKISKMKSAGLAWFAFVTLLILSIVSIVIHGIVTDVRFVTLYMTLFVEFLLMSMSCLAFAILQTTLPDDNHTNNSETNHVLNDEYKKFKEEQRVAKIQEHKERLESTKIKPLTKLNLIFRLSQIGIMFLFVVLVSTIGVTFNSDSTNSIWVGTTYGFIPLILIFSLLIIDSFLSKNFLRNPRFWIGCFATAWSLFITIRSSLLSLFGLSIQDGTMFIIFESIYLSSALFIYALVEFVAYKDRNVTLLIVRIVLSVAYVTTMLLIQMIPVSFNLSPQGIVQAHQFEVFLIVNILIIVYLLGSVLLKYYRFRELPIVDDNVDLEDLN